MLPGPGHTFVPSGILIHPAVWTGKWGLCHLVYSGELSTHLHNVAWTEAYLHTKWHLDASSSLATTDMGRKLGAAPLLGWVAGSHLTQCGRDRGLPPCQVSSWSIQPFGHNTPTSQTDRTDRTDRTVRQTGQRSDSVERTGLQTVAQNAVFMVTDLVFSWYLSNVIFCKL